MTAINILLEEHRLLLQAVETAKRIQGISDNDTYYTQIRGIILFFRNFTEIYHHPKEDNILYPMLRKHKLNKSEEFINEVGDNHDEFKRMIADIENTYLFYNCNQLRKTTAVYIQAMADHVRKENQIVLSIAESLLDAEELEKALQQFESFDEKVGYKDDLINDYLKIESLNMEAETKA
jgi:hemerythrin-like domain-containing protein